MENELERTQSEQTKNDETVVSETPIQTEQQFVHYEEETNLKRLPLAILSGLGASIIGAVIWAVVTVLTGYQIGYMAIGVGFLVGFAIKIVGRGNHLAFGIVGGLFALFGCILGNYFSLISFTSTQMTLVFFETLTMFSPDTVIKIMIESFAPMDILFYALAVYQGFKFSFIS